MISSKDVLIMGSVAAGLWLFAFFAHAGNMPNPSLTPGVTNPAMTKEVLCSPGFTTRSIRPSVSYTDHLKREQLAGPYKGNTVPAEEDHLISLEIGGSPTDPKNLWPEPYTGPWNAHDKDRLENELHRMVCAGTVPLAAAQACIAVNWKACYQGVFK